MSAILMEERLFHAVVSLLIAGFHAAAYLQINTLIAEAGLPERWQAQALLLLLLSLAMSLLAQYRRDAVLRWILFLLLICILLIIGLPSGPHTGVELPLLLSLILLASAALPPAGGAALSLATIPVVAFAQRSVFAWGVVILPPPRGDLVSLVVVAGGFAVICIAFNHLYRQLLDIRRFRRSVEDASRRLVQANLQLQEYAAISEEEAIMTERKRLARDLHDTLAYTLTNLIMMMEAAIDLSGPGKEKLRRHLEQARDQAKEGLVEVRRVIQAIRPRQLSKVTGLRAIHRLVTTFEKATRIQTTLHLRDAPWSFGYEEDIIIYRLIQEGITNALRHGNAKHISIFFAREREGIRVDIQDDGIGFTELKEGYGITGMRERIEKLGGSLQLTSRPKEGTLLSGWLPIRMEPAHE